MLKKISVVAALLIVIASGAVTVGAVTGRSVNGAGPGGAQVTCPGGMTRLGHELAEDMTLFAGDPAVHISNEYTVAEDFFLVEDIDTGAHAGTHLDVPAHFIEGGRTIEELAADEFVWPVYKIDVREMEFADDEIPFIEISDLRAYERRHGRIP
ncbi:MAG: cyclase family protein, partial [Actinomycetota bacterium]